MTTTDSIEYKLLTVLKNTLTYEQPHALRLSFNIKSNNRQLRTSDFTILTLPTTNTIYGKKRFTSIASYKWNRFPKQLLSPTKQFQVQAKKLPAYVKLIIISVPFLSSMQYRKCIIILTVAFSK